MKILPKSFAIFWSLPGSAVQFQADGWRRPLKGGGYEGPAPVVARFREAFPDSIIRSVRDTDGRYLPFNPPKPPKPSKKARVVAALKAGLSSAEIAKAGICSRVYARALERECALGAPRLRKLPAGLKELEELRANAPSLSQAARDLGVTPAGLCLALKRARNRAASHAS